MNETCIFVDIENDTDQISLVKPIITDMKRNKCSDCTFRLHVSIVLDSV